MERPTSITIVAVLNIMLGLFQLIVNVVGLIQSLRPDYPFPAEPVVIKALIGFTVVTTCLATGVGMLKLKPWGRWLAFLLPTLWVIVGVSQVVNIIWDLFIQNVPSIPLLQGLPPLVLAIVIGVVPPVLYFLFLTRSYVKQAFKGIDSKQPVN